MSPRFIWIAGQSGVGKRTLMKRIWKGHGTIRNRFGIVDDESLRFAGSGKLDPVDEFTDCVEEINVLDSLDDRSTSTFILKWQGVAHQYLERMADRFPTAGHDVYVLWRPLDAHFRSMKEKHAGGLVMRNLPTPEALRRQWRNLYSRKFGKSSAIAQRGVHIEIVDASTEHYEELASHPFDL